MAVRYVHKLYIALSVSSRDLPLSAPNQPPCFLCQCVNVPVFKQSLISGK